MADDDELDPPPASPDRRVQQYLDTNYREAVRGARDSRECLRRIYPELTQHLPETAERHLKRALHELEEVAAELHLSGRHILGQEGYDEFLDTLTERQITS